MQKLGAEGECGAGVQEVGAGGPGWVRDGMGEKVRSGAQGLGVREVGAKGA